MDFDDYYPPSSAHVACNFPAGLDPICAQCRLASARDTLSLCLEHVAPPVHCDLQFKIPVDLALSGEKPYHDGFEHLTSDANSLSGPIGQSLHVQNLSSDMSSAALVRLSTVSNAERSPESDFVDTYSALSDADATRS